MKITLLVPESIFQAGERLGTRLGVSRSQLYSDALMAYISEKGEALVTARLNEVYGSEDSTLDESIEQTQLIRLADATW